MAISFDKVQAGDTLFDCHRYGRFREMGTWTVRIIEKREDECLASWNGNKPQVMSRRSIERLRRTPYSPKPRTLALQAQTQQASDANTSVSRKQKEQEQ